MKEMTVDTSGALRQPQSWDVLHRNTQGRHRVVECGGNLVVERGGNESWSVEPLGYPHLRFMAGTHNLGVNCQG